MKNLLLLLAIVTMTFSPLSSHEVEGKIYLTYLLNGREYREVYIEDAIDMINDTVADGIELVIK